MGIETSNQPVPEVSQKNVWDVLLVQDYPGTLQCGWVGGQYLLSGAELWVGKYDYTAVVATQKIATLVPELCENGFAAQATEILKSTEQIMDACHPAGYSRNGKDNRWRDNRWYGICYVIVCTNPSEPDGFNWDPDQRILRCVVFSRLVYPTEIGFQYAARVRFDRDGRINSVYPSPGADAYATVSSEMKTQQRHWLTEEEWMEVSKLLARWPVSRAKNIPRINLAMRYFEKTARQSEFEDSSELLVRTAEALWGRPFGKSKQGRGARFKSGLTQLANEFGIAVSGEDADRAWHHRSRVTHGLGLPQRREPQLPGVEVSQDEAKMVEPHLKVEEVLRTTIRRAIEDDEFAAHFKSETSLNSRLANVE